MMRCPHDNTQLQMMDRQGVEIDYCPSCRGVWLDRGELDKLIERGLAATPAGHRIRDDDRDDDRRYVSPRPPAYDVRRHDDDDDDDDDRRRYGQQGKRRRGWLGDLFDF